MQNLALHNRVYTKKNALFNADMLRALIFAGIAFFASFIPWPEIYYKYFGGILIDREVYTFKVIYNDHWLTYNELRSWIEIFTQEIIWDFSQWSISNGYLGIYHEDFFQIVTTICLISMALVISRTKNYLSILLLFNPLVLDLVYSQLRSALALAVLNIVYLTFRKVNIWMIFGAVVACAIHTASSILVAGFILASLLSFKESFLFRLSPATKTALMLGAGVSVGLLIGPLREVVLSAIGDRRAEYSDLSSSLLYLSFWVALLGFMLVNFRMSVKSVEGCFSIFMLAILATNVFSSAYSIRLIALSLPLIFVAVFHFNVERRIFILSIFSLYAVAQWYFSLTNLTGF